MKQDEKEEEEEEEGKESSLCQYRHAHWTTRTTVTFVPIVGWFDDWKIVGVRVVGVGKGAGCFGT